MGPHGMVVPQEWELFNCLPEANSSGNTLMLDKKAWLAVSTVIHPKGVLSGSGQDSVQASQVLPHQTHPPTLLWTLLCTRGHNHAGTGKGFLQTLPTRPEHRIIKSLFKVEY